MSTNPNQTPRTQREQRLLEAVGEDRNAARRDELLDELITYVVAPGTPLEDADDDEHQEDETE